MNTKWSELTKTEKIIYVIALVFAIAGAVFASLDLFNVWAHAHLGWIITFALFLACEAKLQWAKGRKVAIINLILGIAIVVFGITSELL